MYGRINDLKNREDVEADYMKAEEYRRLMREEGREEGRIEGRIEGRVENIDICNSADSGENRKKL